VSFSDAETMKRMFGVERVTVSPTGVDGEYFQRRQHHPTCYDLCFIGSMDWLPNADAILHFYRDVLPLIRQRIPQCSLAVVGRNPTPEISRLAAERGITVTGTVADVRPYLWSSRVSIVPLRIGGGTRLKIYEAMAAGTPVVSTSIGAEGLAVAHPETIRLADSPEAFAEQCVRLIENHAERERLATAAAALVLSRFSWDTVSRDFANLVFG
ncbi:MAG TPA: glycosyltransferase, partial [Bryobacteraceae bacterium]|nr:glycosyltransferase [Bryobacteraceae bacterium]